MKLINNMFEVKCELNAFGMNKKAQKKLVSFSLYDDTHTHCLQGFNSKHSQNNTAAHSNHRQLASFMACTGYFLI